MADVVMVIDVPGGALLGGSVTVPVMPGRVGKGIGTPVSVAGIEMEA
ncbi:MAG TPA: hypothetical protein VFH72_02055 [Candidatus Baltobacteraceae bacterium]|nr:hypothetical protein [Candidatus Baltobacteraceae bacterium]